MAVGAVLFIPLWRLLEWLKIHVVDDNDSTSVDCDWASLSVVAKNRSTGGVPKFSCGR